MVAQKSTLQQATEESDALKRDITAEKSTKNKLEALYSDLQRQNKQILTDSHQFAEDERQQRIELSTYFKDSINEISHKLEQSEHERLAHVQFSEHLQEKMKELLEQVEKNDNYYKELLDEVSGELDEEKIKLEAPPTAEEETMREELEGYKLKFEHFQNSLSGSNDNFGQFRKDMDTRTKAFKKAQKHNFELTRKINDSNEMIANMKREREELTAGQETLRQALAKLQQLKQKLS